MVGIVWGFCGCCYLPSAAGGNCCALTDKAWFWEGDLRCILAYSTAVKTVKPSIS